MWSGDGDGEWRRGVESELGRTAEHGNNQAHEKG